MGSERTRGRGGFFRFVFCGRTPGWEVCAASEGPQVRREAKLKQLAEEPVSCIFF